MVIEETKTVELPVVQPSLVEETDDWQEPTLKQKLIAPLVITAVLGLTISVSIAGWIYGTMDPRGHRHGLARRDASGALVSATGARIPDRYHGQELFNTTCFACHGPTGAGLPNLGANMRQSKFIASHSDDELLAFIKRGRLPGEPNSVLNLTMPPKGGNPALDDAALRDIIAFIRTFRPEEKKTVAGAE